MIPIEKFCPISAKYIEETGQKGTIQIPERSKPFVAIQKEVSKKLHQGDSKRLEALMDVSKSLQKNAKDYFYEERFDKTLDLHSYAKNNTERYKTVLDFWRDAILQSNTKIRDMLMDVKKQIEAEIKLKMDRATYESAKKNIGEARIPQEIITTLSQFQSLIEFLFEREIRNSFERSLGKFVQHFKTIREHMIDSLEDHTSPIVRKQKQKQVMITGELDQLLQVSDDAIFKHRMKKLSRLKTELRYSSEHGLHYKPSLEHWKEEILKLVDGPVKQLSQIECLSTTDLGSARTAGKMIILEKQMNDPYIVEQSLELRKVLDDLFRLPTGLFILANQYNSLLDEKKDLLEGNIDNEKATIEMYNEQLMKLDEAKNSIELLFPTDEVFLGLFIVKCKDLRERFEKEISKMRRQLFKAIKARIERDVAGIDNAVNKVLNKLQEIPPYIEELVEQNKFIVFLESKRVEIQKMIAVVFEEMALLEQYQYKLTKDEFSDIFKVFRNSQNIMKQKRESMARNSELYANYKLRLAGETSKLLIEIGSLKEKLDNLQLKTDINDYDRIAYEYNQLGDQINNAFAKADLVISREKLLLLPNTSFDELNNTKKVFDPYERLWNITRDYFSNYPQWTTGPLGTIDRDKLNDEVKRNIEALRKLIDNNLTGDPANQQVATTVLQCYIKFTPLLPLVYDLRNPALIPKHWEEIKSVTGIAIPEGLQISLKDLLSKGIEKYQDQINEISDTATKRKTLLNVR